MLGPVAHNLGGLHTTVVNRSKFATSELPHLACQRPSYSASVDDIHRERSDEILSLSSEGGTGSEGGSRRALLALLALLTRSRAFVPAGARRGDWRKKDGRRRERETPVEVGALSTFRNSWT